MQTLHVNTEDTINQEKSLGRLFALCRLIIHPGDYMENLHHHVNFHCFL